MTQVFNLLEIDAKYRYLGVTDDLFTLHDLSPESTWQYELPTLTNTHEYGKKKINKNNDNFKDLFFKTFIFLDNINLNNLLIAGGSIKSLLFNTTVNDIDVFMYDLNNHIDAQLRMEIFILDIYKHLINIRDGFYVKNELDKLNIITKSMLPNENAKIVREFEQKHKQIYNPKINTEILIYSNGNTITLFINNIKVQIILRLYSTISEILHGFDLGSSAVGFDGKNVYFTSLSKFSFENMVNIIDTTRRSTTYENRIIKYFESGFSIIIPNLNIHNLKLDYHKYQLNEVCELPYMTFSYSSINGNLIKVNKFYKNNGYTVNTDYDFYGQLNCNNGSDDIFALQHYNVSQLISGKNRFVIKIDLSDEINILKSKKINIDNWKLNFNKPVVEYDFIERTYNNLAIKLNIENILMEKIRKYINVVDNKDFVQSVYINTTNGAERKQKIISIIELQKLKLKKSLNQAINIKINWITENPTTQLTSSINPIIDDTKQWYGNQYYISTKNLIIESTFNSAQIHPNEYIFNNKCNSDTNDNNNYSCINKCNSDDDNDDDLSDEKDYDGEEDEDDENNEEEDNENNEEENQNDNDSNSN